MAKTNIDGLSLSDLLLELKRFEAKYEMSSAEFYERFNEGKMGDSAAITEWAGLYEWAQRKEARTTEA